VSGGNNRSIIGTWISRNAYIQLTELVAHSLDKAVTGMIATAITVDSAIQRSPAEP